MYSTSLVALLALSLAVATPALAQDKEPAPASAKKKRVLTPEEKKEKEQRKTCKIQMCDVLYSKNAEGPDISCDIIKTWREEDVEEMVTGGKIDWPWGAAKCTTKLTVSRELLAKAAGSDSYVAKLKPHKVACTLDRKSEGKTYDVVVGIQPEVTFEKGRAVKSQVNWGDIEAPMLAYGVIWPGAKLDNSLNAMGGTVTKMVNEFVSAKCDEIKDLVPSRKAAN